MAWVTMTIGPTTLTTRMNSEKIFEKFTALSPVVHFDFVRFIKENITKFK